MDSRALANALDTAAARVIATRLIANNDRLGDSVTELQWEVGSEERAAFDSFGQRIKDFQEFRRELVRRGTEIDPAAARALGENEVARAALNRDIEQMGQAYAQRSKQLYADIERGVRESSWMLAALAVFLLLLAVTGAIIVWRSCIRPLAIVTTGHRTRRRRPAQCGRCLIASAATRSVHLPCSIAIFQAAMRRNKSSTKPCAVTPKRVSAARTTSPRKSHNSPVTWRRRCAT